MSDLLGRKPATIVQNGPGFLIGSMSRPPRGNRARSTALDARAVQAGGDVMRAARSLVVAATVLTPVSARADVTILRCHGENVETHEPQDIGVALDMDAKHVLDFGQGEGVETTDFTATTIKARLDPIGAQKNKHFRIRIGRVDGRFVLVTRVDETGGPLGAETRVKGTCEAAQRKF